jgi:hypothetical protein
MKRRYKHTFQTEVVFSASSVHSGYKEAFSREELFEFRDASLLGY